MLITPEPFSGFGPNHFDPISRDEQVNYIRAAKAAKLRAGVRAQCPRSPGVYGMLDPRGRLIYVGKAKCLRARLLSYFRSGRDPKAGKIIAQTRELLWEQGPNEFAALLRELELIRRFRPSFNVSGQPGRRRFVYLALGRGPVSYCHLTREASKKPLALYGPLASARRLSECVRRVNDLFQLRDCPQSQTFHFADQKEFFPSVEAAGCLRYDIGTCLGPCVAAVTKSSYGRRVREAKAFLDGLDVSALDQLEGEMHTAATSFSYERAANLRDKILDLRWLQERLAWLQKARQEYSFVYPTMSADGQLIWYLIRGGRVFAATLAPCNPRCRTRARKVLDSVFPLRGGPPNVVGEHVDHVLLVTAWFRRYADEMKLTLGIERARALCAPASVSA